jgi:hypothetical protein
MDRVPRQQLSILTVGSLLGRNQGINLRCICGHRTALLPAQISQMTHPATKVLDFARRFRCSMCGVSGASGDLRVTLFDAGSFGGNVADASDADAPVRPLGD